MSGKRGDQASEKNRRQFRGKLCSGKTAYMRRILLLLFFTNFSVASAFHSPQEAPALLEVRFNGPLRWENSCLRGGVDIVNRSASELFLTRMGPYFYIALNVSKNDSDSQKGDALEWVNIYGVTDLATLEADSIPGGSSVHRDFCFQPTVWVVNMGRGTRREIPVRGRLRVNVSYFTSEAGWRKYKDSWREKERQDSRLWTTAFAEIPCPKATCELDCARPPVGVHDEGRPVPDFGQFFPEMNARGRQLTDELSRKFPPCSRADTTPQEDSHVAN